jgi:hypothetical protein
VDAAQAPYPPYRSHHLRSVEAAVVLFTDLGEGLNPDGQFAAVHGGPRNASESAKIRPKVLAEAADKQNEQAELVDAGG